MSTARTAAPGRRAALSPAELGTVLVTGCSTGIGRALALELARRGHAVIATARDPATLGELAAAGCRTAALDVADAASIAALGIDALGIGLLVNNAGFGVMGPASELELGAVRRGFETNVVGALAVAQAVIPSMIRAGRGRIANVSSVSGVLVTPFSGAYCATKAALSALGDAMRVELAPFGVAVITVQPGAIRSDFGATASAGIPAARIASSPYAPIAATVARRATAGQEGAMPTADFARGLADALTARRPASVVRIGRHSGTFPRIRRWLPLARIDRMMTRRFGLDALRPAAGRTRA